MAWMGATNCCQCRRAGQAVRGGHGHSCRCPCWCWYSQRPYPKLGLGMVHSLGARRVEGDRRGEALALHWHEPRSSAHAHWQHHWQHCYYRLRAHYPHSPASETQPLGCHRVAVHWQQSSHWHQQQRRVRSHPHCPAAGGCLLPVPVTPGCQCSPLDPVPVPTVTVCADRFPR